MLRENSLPSEEKSPLEGGIHQNPSEYPLNRQSLQDDSESISSKKALKSMAQELESTDHFILLSIHLNGSDIRLKALFEDFPAIDLPKVLEMIEDKFQEQLDKLEEEGVYTRTNRGEDLSE